MENLLIPYTAISSLPGCSILVFAPHPDDEVFGCGGAVARHVAAGVPVRTIIVTDGAHGAVNREDRERITHVRMHESIEAAKCLGVTPPEFWGLPDRSLEFGPELIERVLSAVVAGDHDLIYAPSIREAHPDHRTLGMVVLEVLRCLGGERRLAMYEVGIPLPANNLVDITRYMEVKQAAMRCFCSQLDARPYDRYLEGLARYRTYTLPPTVEAAEAFQVVTAAELQAGWLDVYEPEYVRQAKLGLCMDSARQLPLVSVIIRSMDRPTLQEALDSVALQTYANIEVVVVAACGPKHGPLPAACGRFPMRLVVDPAGALARSAAANTGLDAAKGDYLIFLDDDDWIDPPHLENLVAALSRNHDVRVAYASVRTVDNQRQSLETVFNHPYDPVRLLAGNYLPIHAVLFHRSLVTNDGCRFDPSFEMYEDWDFWLQVACHGPYLHIDQITANYRIGSQGGFGIQASGQAQYEGKRQVYAKWRLRISEQQWQAAMDRIYEHETISASCVALRGTLNEAYQARAQMDAALAECNTSLARAREQNVQLQARQEQSAREAQATQEVLRRQEVELAERHQFIALMEHSLSWRMTAPMRALKRMVLGIWQGKA